MHKNNLRILTGFALIACLVTSPLAVAQTVKLPTSVLQLLKQYQVPLEAVSLSVQSVDAQLPLIALNDLVRRNPASVIKTVTTMAALELLGPHYQWHTKYYIDGPLVDGVVEGNLIMQGRGDPFLTVDKFWQHLHSLRIRGVRSITGDLIIDNTAFNLPHHDRGAFDGQNQRLYNVGPDAALTNFSATRFILEPVDGRVNVIADPPLANLTVRNNLSLANGKCVSARNGWKYNLSETESGLVATFNGKYRSRCGVHSISRSILQNNNYTYQLFRQIWGQLGGTLQGGLRIGNVEDQHRLMVSHPSEPLADIATSINKYSNNVMARQLLLTIGLELSGEPSTTASGVNGIGNWLTANGILMPGLAIENGSGLSRKSRATSAGLIALLQHAWRSNYRPEFLSSLSLASLDGTMRKRLKKSAVSGRARIKTGLINGVRSMAGYVHARNRQHYAVAMMIESPNVNYWIGNQIQDAVLEWVHNR